MIHQNSTIRQTIKNTPKLKKNDALEYRYIQYQYV